MNLKSELKTQSKIKIDDSLSVYIVPRGEFLIENKFDYSFVLSEYGLKKLYSYYEKYKICDSTISELKLMLDKKEQKFNLYKYTTFALSGSLITMLFVFLFFR